MNLLEAQNIVKKYGNYTALNRVNLAVPEGSIYGLLGPNGAGKTTLIRIINQILAPDTGELLFEGRKMKPDDVASIGYLPEERGLYKKMKVGEQALYLCQLKGLSKAEAQRKLKYWFEKFEITGWWDKKVEDLSKGMAQKVQFIVTVLHKPRLLIFDEPFSGFDPINATLMRDEILELRKNGATIIFSTHNMNSVEELCDNITLINQSQAILEGEVREVKKRFASDMFEVTYKGDYARFANAVTKQFEVMEQRNGEQENLLRVRTICQAHENELLSMMLPHVQVTSFREVYPTMNDIFIEVIESYNQKNASHE
jgi:ABC-2 type transport system ATP-binding protein